MADQPEHLKNAPTGARMECGYCDGVFYGLKAFDEHFVGGSGKRGADALSRCPGPKGPKRLESEAREAKAKQERLLRRRVK